MYLKNKFKNKFQDFKSLENVCALFTSLFSIDAVKVPAQIKMKQIKIKKMI